MTGKTAKVFFIALLTLALSFGVVKHSPAYAANISIALDCAGSSNGASVNEGDTVSFYDTSTSSDVATLVNLSNGDSLGLGASSSPLSAGVVTYADDCIIQDSGTITVSAAADPTPPPPGGTTGGSTGSTTKPSSSSTTTTKPPTAPTVAPTVLAVTTTNASHNSNLWGFGGKYVPLVAKKSSFGLTPRVELGAGAVLLAAAIGLSIYYFIRRRTARSPNVKPHVTVPLEEPVASLPPLDNQPLHERYRRPPGSNLGGPLSVGG